MVLHVIIERTYNNYYAYIKEVNGITAVGKDFKDVKDNMIQAIEAMIDECNEFGYDVPIELQGEFDIEFISNIEPFSDFFSNLSKAFKRMFN